MPPLPKPAINLEILPSPSLPSCPIVSHKDTVWPHFSDSRSEDHCTGVLSQPWEGEALDAEERKPPDQTLAYSIPSRLLSSHNSAWLLCFSKPKPKKCVVLVCSLDLQFCEIWSGHTCSAFFLVARLPRTAAVTLCDRQDEQSSLLFLRVLSDLCAHTEAGLGCVGFLSPLARLVLEKVGLWQIVLPSVTSSLRVWIVK